MAPRRLLGRTVDAAPLVENAAERGNAIAVMRLALLRALQGRHAEARTAAERSLALASQNRYYHHLTYEAARVYALGGNAEQASKWLQETIRWGFPCYPLFAEDRFLDPVRQAHQFQRVMEELRRQWERYRQERDAN